MGRGDGHKQKAARVIRRNEIPVSTDFVSVYGRLAEYSQLETSIDGATLCIEENPPIDEETGSLIAQIGIEDEWQGKESWTTRLEMPRRDNTSFDISSDQASRALAIHSIKAFEARLLEQGAIQDKPSVKILSFPSETVPAMLWAEVSLPEIGRINMLSSGDNLHEALREIQTVFPQAEMPS